MSACVIESGGVLIIATLETYPQCSEFAISDAANLSALTYWADVSVMLEPPAAWPFYSAVLLVFATAWGIKQIARLILNR